MSCGGSRSDDGSKTIILAHAMHLTHPVTIAMDRMAELTEEKSEGQLKIEIYPTSQLGGERELLELVQIGTIGITKISGAVLENIVPAMQAMSLPYLFRDEEHYANVLWGDVGRDMLLEGEKYRLRGIAYYDAGMRSFYSVGRPINTPADLAGMKIRVQPSVMAINLIRAYGGSATPLAYGELYTAFQGGIVDGAENNPPSFYTSRHYEVTDYYILNEHTAVPDVLVIGTKVWDTLTDQERTWLMEAVNESVDFQRELWKESEEESLRIVQEAGVEVIHPDKEPFRERVQHIYDNVRERDPELYRWIERIQQVQ
ncbi:TRAP transporter substrate-binding protein [Rhodohalobacter sp. SW132]|uniref:TRAP transporter substrate-binding protein n=1 Tax=Rhodohalobacter sp. SW132 TaxID=2293433 RepID=UPI0018F55D1D|nr:TRAP transporter substrate-binding protein [Rhodohalobacter sp. SW132]